MATAAERSTLRGITGRSDDPEYAGGERGGSVWAARVRALLEEVPYDELTGAQRDYMGRVLSGGLACLREAARGRHATRRAWRPGPGTPAAVPRTDYLLGRYWEADAGLVTGWLDHPYRLAFRDGSPPWFVSEPYEIGNEGIRHLAAVIDAGWDVQIGAARATHFPAHTVAVVLEKRPREGRPEGRST
jgi:hypothetical protein